MEKTNRVYTVDVWIDAGIYRAFSIFDTIRKDRKWVRPVLFAGAFILFSAASFSMRGNAKQATLLGTVLLIIGLGVPLAYFGSYFALLKKRVDKLKIKTTKRHAYCVTLSEDAGMRVQTPKGEETAYPWDGIHKAYLLPNAVYIYPEVSKAYILPKEQAGDSFQDIWRLICDSLPPERRKEQPATH